MMIKRPIAGGMTDLDTLMDEVRDALYMDDMERLRRRIAGGRKGDVMAARKAMIARTAAKLREEISR